MVNDAEWYEWMSEPWIVVQDPAISGMWAIIMAKDDEHLVTNALTPVYHDEEVARHIVRAHNCYLAVLRNEGKAGDYTSPASGRTPEP